MYKIPCLALNLYREMVAVFDLNPDLLKLADQRGFAKSGVADFRIPVFTDISKIDPIHANQGIQPVGVDRKVADLILERVPSSIPNLITIRPLTRQSHIMLMKTFRYGWHLPQEAGFEPGPLNFIISPNEIFMRY